MRPRLSLTLAKVPVARDETDAIVVDEPWFIQRDASSGALAVGFERASDKHEESWTILRRLAQDAVEAVRATADKHPGRPRELRLRGPFNAAETALRGASVSLVAAFRGGFPENLEELCVREEPAEASARNDEEEEEKQEEETPLALRRGKRAVTMVEPLVYDEDELLLRALRKAERSEDAALQKVLGLREEDMTSDESDDEEAEASEGASTWTKEEVDAFHAGRLVLNPTSGSFWDRLSRDFVKTRTADECKLRWVYECTQTGSKKDKQKHSSKSANGKSSEEEAMERAERAARVGTAKFRKQVRNEWERVHVKRTREGVDLEASTPFRDSLRISNMPLSEIKTPADAFTFGNSRRKRVNRLSAVDDTDGEEEAEPVASPAVLVPVNRDNLDDYLVGLVKEKTKLQAYQAKTKRGGRANGTSKYDASIRHQYFAGSNGLVELNAGCVQATMTPGGHVRLEVMGGSSDVEEKQDDDDEDADSVW